MTPDDGRGDFDFIHGAWTVCHRRLTSMLDPACTEWQELSGTSRAEPLLGGFGHIDRLWIPGEPAFEGMTLRLFEPQQRLWRIWWSSTSRPGLLDDPMIGCFADGLGWFEHDEVVDGIPIGVRFHWHSADHDAPRWEQQFSFDGGERWITNWTMDFRREPT